MFHTTTKTNRRNLSKASGEELLLLAIFGPSSMKAKIDRELDRRATRDTANSISIAASVPAGQGAYAA